MPCYSELVEWPVFDVRSEVIGFSYRIVGCISIRIIRDQDQIRSDAAGGIVLRGSSRFVI